MVVICVDSSNRPESIPLSSWIEKGEKYTVVNAFYGFGGVLIFQLAERDLTPFPPYKGFDANRFRPSEDLDSFVFYKEEVEEYAY